MKNSRTFTVVAAGGLMLLLRQRSPGGLVYDVIVRSNSHRLGKVEKQLARPKSWKAYAADGREIAKVPTRTEAVDAVVATARRGRPAGPPGQPDQAA